MEGWKEDESAGRGDELVIDKPSRPRRCSAFRFFFAFDLCPLPPSFYHHFKR